MTASGEHLDAALSQQPSDLIALRHAVEIDAHAHVEQLDAARLTISPVVDDAIGVEFFGMRTVTSRNTTYTASASGSCVIRTAI